MLCTCIVRMCTLKYTCSIGGPGMSMHETNLEFEILLTVLPLRFKKFTTHTSIKRGGICNHNMYHTVMHYYFK